MTTPSPILLIGIGILLVGGLFLALQLSTSDTPGDPIPPRPGPGPGPGPTPNPTPTPGVEVEYAYSFEQFKSGNIDTILHCAGPLFNPEEYNGYVNTFSSTPPIMVRFNIGLEDNPRITFAQKVADIVEDITQTYPNEIPFLSITYTVRSHNAPADALDEEVVNGELDDKIRLLAQGVKAFNRPTFIRIASEFNGNWNNYEKEYYADSYRHIVDLFREEGVDQAIFMWNYEALHTPFPYMEWYPGDEYVDWWSMDIFSLQFENVKANANMIQFLEDAKARGKPVILPESAPNSQDMEDPATWNSWFAPYFELINNPAYTIKGFCYSNRDFGKYDVGLKEWGNMRIDQSDALKGKYQEELKKEQYYHIE